MDNGVNNSKSVPLPHHPGVPSSSAGKKRVPPSLCLIILSKRTGCHLIDLFSCENQVSLLLMSVPVIGGRQPRLPAVSRRRNPTARSYLDIRAGIAFVWGVCTAIPPLSPTAGWPPAPFLLWLKGLKPEIQLSCSCPRDQIIHLAVSQSNVSFIALKLLGSREHLWVLRNSLCPGRYRFKWMPLRGSEWVQPAA